MSKFKVGDRVRVYDSQVISNKGKITDIARDLLNSFQNLRVVFDTGFYGTYHEKQCRKLVKKKKVASIVAGEGIELPKTTLDFTPLNISETNQNIRLNVLEKRCKEIEEREKLIEGYWHSLERVESDVRNLNELVGRVFRLEINSAKFSEEWGKRITEIDNYTRLDLRKRIEGLEQRLSKQCEYTPEIKLLIANLDNLYKRVVTLERGGISFIEGYQYIT